MQQAQADRQHIDQLRAMMKLQQQAVLQSMAVSEKPKERKPLSSESILCATGGIIGWRQWRVPCFGDVLLSINGQEWPIREALRAICKGINILAESDSVSHNSGGGSSDDEGEHGGVWLPSWLSVLSGLPEGKRRRRILAMMQAYVDDSGNNGQAPIFVLSALIADAQFMAATSDAWQSVLDESPSIEYFKMDEAASCDGQFYGFSPAERDAKLKRFCSLLATYRFTEFSFAMPSSVFNETFGSRSGRPLSERYFFPFHCAIVGVATELDRQGEKVPFEIFFDEDVIFGPRAKAWYPIVRASLVGTPIYGLLPVEPFFRDDRTTLPLQAADLIAWIRRKVNSSEGLGCFYWLPSALKGLHQSPCSQSFSREMGEAILDRNRNLTPELLLQRQAMLNAYRDTFGHEWPPRTKAQRRIARGRSKKQR